MQIDAYGSMAWLEEFSHFLRLQLESNGYTQGPRVGWMDAGSCRSFLKEETIVTVQLNEAESGDSNLHLECEVEVPGLDEIWDDALIALGRDIHSRIRRMARDAKKVEQAL